MPLVQKPECDECGKLTPNGRYIRKDSVWFRIEHVDKPEKKLVSPDPAKRVFCSPECALKASQRALVKAWNEARGVGVRLIDLAPGQDPPPGKVVCEEIIDGEVRRYYESG